MATGWSSSARTTTDEQASAGVGMKIAVDLTKCQNHGQCTHSAPGVFTLTEDGQLAVRLGATGEFRSGELDEALRGEVEEAIDMCPMQAIRGLDDEGRE